MCLSQRRMRTAALMLLSAIEPPSRCRLAKDPKDAVRFWASHVSTMTSASRGEVWILPGNVGCTHHVLESVDQQTWPSVWT
ncbi:hypothetical protein B0T13DRAFT_486684 [Neurospora crassa]|nr:hypothetical protein B0T13DRAFT_486684 [Neurospora crassa]